MRGSDNGAAERRNKRLKLEQGFGKNKRRSHVTRANNVQGVREERVRRKRRLDRTKHPPPRVKWVNNTVGLLNLNGRRRGDATSERVSEQGSVKMTKKSRNLDAGIMHKGCCCGCAG